MPVSAVPSESETLALVARLDPRYRPVWEGRSVAEQVALGRYFLPRSRGEGVVGVGRPRVLCWYCPFADQQVFPSGHRYCCNVYVGCAHGCVYCYARAYSGGTPHPKRGFERALLRDLDDLERFDVPPAPLHVSNSTDPFQALERRLMHTRFLLEQVQARRGRFSSVTLLTKDPGLAAQEPWLSRLAAIEGVRVEVSVAFADEVASRLLDPGAPGPAERLEGVRRLREAGVPVVLRIDPLVPRSPLPLPGRPSLSDFGLPELQTLDDLARLVDFAAEVGVRHVIWSPLKIVRGRGVMPQPLAALLAVYRALSRPGRPVWRGGSWRLPGPVAAEHVVRPLRELCRQAGLRSHFCMDRLLGTP